MSNTKVFSRENPCTKADLWKCFYRNGDFVRVPVIESRAIIGLNAPKYLIAKGYAVMRHDKKAGVDLYQLTESGEVWLSKGYAAYVKANPEQARSTRPRVLPRLPRKSA